jgi:hypothetical protein
MTSSKRLVLSENFLPVFVSSSGGATERLMLQIRVYSIPLEIDLP